jgi:ABC-2 type transport system permease protein
MKLVFSYLKAETAQLLRIPFVIIASWGFPGLFFLIMGLPNAKDQVSATFIMASYALFAVLGIGLFQFGVNIAEDRVSPWESYLRTLPVTAITRFTSRILMALLFALSAAGIIIVLGLTFSPARFTLSTLFPFFFVLLVGGIPFALFGITIGYWMPFKVALPVANLIYFLLAYAGGLWYPPQYLPSFVATISPYLPTRQYGELAWDIVLGQPWQVSNWIGLCVYTLIFGMLAIWGYKKDEGQRFK